jgi:hypothetical protein
VGFPLTESDSFSISIKSHIFDVCVAIITKQISQMNPFAKVEHPFDNTDFAFVDYFVIRLQRISGSPYAWLESLSVNLQAPVISSCLFHGKRDASLLYCAF